MVAGRESRVRGIGFSSVVREDHDFEQLKGYLSAADELGVEFVELPFMSMDLIAGGRILPGQVQKLVAALKGSTLGFTVHGPIGINFFHAPDIVTRHVRIAKASLEIAGEIGARHFVLHTGYGKFEDAAAIEAAYAVQRTILAELGDFAARYGIVIAVENIWLASEAEHTALPSRLAAEIDAIGHPNVRACLDFSHAAILCSMRGADFMTEVKALARVAKHLHIHDSFGDHIYFRTSSRSEHMAYGLGDLHLPLGWGSIPWTPLMESCVFEDGVILNLELPPQFRHALGDCIARVRAMADTYTDARGGMRDNRAG